LRTSQPIRPPEICGPGSPDGLVGGQRLDTIAARHDAAHDPQEFAGPALHRTSPSFILRSSALIPLLVLTAACSAARGAPPIEEQPLLRWGADQEGGGPYIFPRDDDPSQVTGFEVDLAEALAKQMGRRAAFVQSDWNRLLQVLDRGNIDVALNGYEYSAERAERYLASLPYYIYELGLCARRDDGSVRSWESLGERNADGRMKRVGVLEGSAADRFLTARYGTVCNVVRFDGSTEALMLVESGQLDATVQDLPILHFYVEHLKRYPRLALVDRPAASGYYVIYVRAREESLISDVNEAIRRLRASGELQSIYERYGIWNATQAKLENVWSSWDSSLQKSAANKWGILGRQIPLLIKAAGVTVALSLVSMPLAIMIGLTVALVRSWNSPALGGAGTNGTLVGRLVRLPFTLYVELVRGTPLAFQLFIVYFILPEVTQALGVGFRIDEFWSGVVALAINYSAYEAEIFRLGLQAVPRGQMEAALSLGMSRFLAVRRIVLPQAVRLVIPATANDFIALFKDTAVCSVIAVEELSKQYSMGAKSTGLFLEMAALASVLYLLMSYPLSLLSAWLERKLKGSDERG
jgi:polar amino acid transport system substrate-binding protein